MTNSEEEFEYSPRFKLPPLDFICTSCKRRQLAESDQLDDHASDAAHKRLKREAIPDDDDPSACLGKMASSKECIENDKDQLLRESAEDELKRLRKEWTSPIYAFFKSSPTIHYVGNRRVHVFECLAENCKAKGKNPRFVNRYLDKADARSTSNLRKHVKTCWGTNILAEADKIKDLDAIRAVVGETELKDGSLAAAFEGMRKGKLTYILSFPEKDIN